MKIHKSFCTASLLSIIASIFLFAADTFGSPSVLGEGTKVVNNARRTVGKRRSPSRPVLQKTNVKPSLPLQVTNLAVRSLRDTSCKDLFNLRSTTPDALVESPDVKISFVDLSRVEIAPGNWGKVVGISGGTSGTVEVEQPDGKRFYSERILAERSGLKIIRVVQGGGGRIRIHKDLKPTVEVAFVLNHELGHVADKMFGDDASLIINDAASTADVSKELHRKNDKTMAACRADLLKL